MKPTLVGGSEVIRTLLLVSCAMTTAGVAGPSLCYGTPVVTSGIASLQLSVFGPVEVTARRSAELGHRWYFWRGHWEYLTYGTSGDGVYYDEIKDTGDGSASVGIRAISASSYANGYTPINCNGEFDVTVLPMEPYLKERTEEGDVWQIGSIQIGGLFALAGGGYGLYEATAALGFTAPTAALRTYLSEYSVVEGRWVDFNDSGPLVGSGQLSMTYTVDGQITAPTAEDGVFGLNRNIGVYVVTAVPEPSTYAMALAGLACGGYSLFRRRKRA